MRVPPPPHPQGAPTGGYIIPSSPLSAILSCHYAHLLINLTPTAWQNIIKFQFFTTAKKSLKAFEFWLVSPPSGFKRCQGVSLSQFSHSYLILISFSNFPHCSSCGPNPLPPRTTYSCQRNRLKSCQNRDLQGLAGRRTDKFMILIKNVSNKNIEVFCSSSCKPNLPWSI